MIRLRPLGVVRFDDSRQYLDIIATLEESFNVAPDWVDEAFNAVLVCNGMNTHKKLHLLKRILCSSMVDVVRVTLECVDEAEGKFEVIRVIIAKIDCVVRGFL